MRQPDEVIVNGKKLSDILDSHGAWILGYGGQRADLSDANLYLVNLSGVCLSGGKLTTCRFG